MTVRPEDYPLYLSDDDIEIAEAEKNPAAWENYEYVIGYAIRMGFLDGALKEIAKACRMRHFELNPTQAVGRAAVRPAAALTGATPPRSSSAAKNASVTPGMYKHSDGVFYRVRESRKTPGAVYAEELLVEREAIKDRRGKVITPAVVKFKYRPRQVGSLNVRDRLTMEDMANFGVMFGVCMDCGKALTTEESVARGIGPVCMKKHEGNNN